MVDIPVTSTNTTVSPAPTHRISSKTFWLLFAIEALVISLLLIWIMPNFMPAQAPLSQAQDYATVRNAITAHLSGTTVDPMVQVSPNVMARTSNLAGFDLNGYTYYYAFEGKVSFDPLSRNELSRNEVEIVSYEQIGTESIVIYRTNSKNRAN
jgi:hypothetical protein